MSAEYSVDAKEYLDNCVNALDHIARTARNCRVTSKRLTWIASRAESAINSNDAWRDAPVPVNGTSALLRAQARIKELEAALAAQGQGEPVAKVRHFDYRGIARNGFSQEAQMLDGAPVLPDGTPLYTRPATAASPAGVPDGWVSDPDTIPKPIIDACRDAICREFGNNGTDGYYKRILAKVFAALAAAPSATPEGGEVRL